MDALGFFAIVVLSPPSTELLPIREKLSFANFISEPNRHEVVLERFIDNKQIFVQYLSLSIDDFLHVVADFDSVLTAVVVLKWVEVDAWEVKGGHFDTPSFLLHLVEAIEVIQQLLNIACDKVELAYGLYLFGIESENFDTDFIIGWHLFEDIYNPTEVAPEILHFVVLELKGQGDILDELFRIF